MTRCIALLLVYASIQLSFSATNTPASTALEVVQQTVNASLAGDTVQFLPGIHAWAGQLTNYGKSLILRGAGDGLYGDEGSPTIISNASTTFKDPLIWVRFLGTNKFRIQNMVFDANQNSSQADGMVLIGPKDVKTQGGGETNSFVRIHNSRFINIRYSGVVWKGMSWGVMDHNSFESAVTAGTLNGFRQYGHTNAWDHGPNYTSTNRLYVENCQFLFADDGNGAYDLYNACLLTFRYNFVLNTVVGWHGLDSGNGYRAPHSISLHNNTLVTEISLPPLIQIRGGTALIYSNIVTHPNQPSNLGRMSIYRSYFTNVNHNAQDLATGPYAPWGILNGSDSNLFASIHPDYFTNWTSPPSWPNRYDGYENSTGYPALDGVGMTGPTTFGLTNSTQVHAPVYAWSNIFNGVMGAGRWKIDVYNNDCGLPVGTDFTQRGRDFFDDGPVPSDFTELAYPHPWIQLDNPNNLPPTLSPIPDIEILEGGSTGPLAFTIADGEDAPEDLVLSSTSSNPTLIPDASVVFGGSGSARTVNATAALGQAGFSTITVTVTDTGGLSASEQFTVTVTPTPLPPVGPVIRATVARIGTIAPP